MMGRDLLDGSSLAPSRLPKGMLRAPATWPAAYSAGSLTSTTTAFSRLISSTAWAVLTAPARVPRVTSGHTSMPPETKATRMRNQLSMMNFTWET
jgi:hypothetical protein